MAAVGCAAIVAALVFTLARSPSASTVVDRSPLLGKPAPSFDGKLLLGKPDPFLYAGRFVLLNFFGTWCPGCVAEHGELKAFSLRHAISGDAVVVSVVFADTASNVRSFFRRENSLWPVFLDESGRIATDFGVGTLPETYLISPAGDVIAKFVGQIHDSRDVDRLIAEFVAQRPQG